MDALKILVVDDDMMSRQMAEFILKKAGYMVSSVSSGEEALSALENDDYSLVLLDVDMPEKDGIETLKDIRNITGPKKDVPVLFLTADESERTVSSAALLNAAGLVKKPFLPEDLLSRIGEALA